MVWFVAGMITGIAVTLLALPLWRAGVLNVRNPAVRYTLAMGVIVLLGSSILMVFLRTGTAKPGVAAQPTAARSAPSMESAAAGLAERLHKNGGSREDWLLLARSYDFMGRTAEANEARAHAATAELR